MLLDATTLSSEINYLQSQTARLPWRWQVTARTYDDVQAFDIHPADCEGTPAWLPNFTIKRLSAGYEVSAFLSLDDVDDKPQPPDETLEAAFGFVPDFLAVMLEDCGLQRIARDLPEEV